MKIFFRIFLMRFVDNYFFNSMLCYKIFSNISTFCQNFGNISTFFGKSPILFGFWCHFEALGEGFLMTLFLLRFVGYQCTKSTQNYFNSLIFRQKTLKKSKNMENRNNFGVIYWVNSHRILMEVGSFESP